jgi:hypothetical protein
MTNIHYLRTRTEPGADQTEQPDGRVGEAAPLRSASVILFTGVRYERWLEPPDAEGAGTDKAKTPAKSKVKRG